MDWIFFFHSGEQQRVSVGNMVEWHQGHFFFDVYKISFASLMCGAQRSNEIMNQGSGSGQGRDTNGSLGCDPTKPASSSLLPGKRRGKKVTLKSWPCNRGAAIARAGWAVGRGEAAAGESGGCKRLFGELAFLYPLPLVRIKWLAERCDQKLSIFPLAAFPNEPDYPVSHQLRSHGGASRERAVAALVSPRRVSGAGRPASPSLHAALACLAGAPLSPPIRCDSP